MNHPPLKKRRIQRALTNGVPDGWTVEAFTAWLDGPTPEGWTDEQWTTYVQDAKAELSSSPQRKGDVLGTPVATMAIGYVLINAQPGTEQSVYEGVRSLPHVTDATVLFGDHDLIVKLEANDLATIAKAVVEHIRSVDGVMETKTLAGADLS